MTDFAKQGFATRAKRHGPSGFSLPDATPTVIAPECFENLPFPAGGRRDHSIAIRAEGNGEDALPFANRLAIQRSRGMHIVPKPHGVIHGDGGEEPAIRAEIQEPHARVVADRLSQR